MWSNSLVAQDVFASDEDVLVYNDGDRVQGRFLRSEDGVFVFQSNRFGELRVPLSEASVIARGASVPPLPLPGEQAPAAVGVDGSPHELTRALREFFGPWSGRLVLSSQLARDASERVDFMVEASLERKWMHDEIYLMTRYDFNETDDVNTTHFVRGNGRWRHALPKRFFAAYRPSYEWLRSGGEQGVNNNYVLLQQELGLGVKAVDRPDWQLRVGVAQNFFNTWDLRTETDHATRVESVFLETDLTLPWRILVTERAVYYFAFDSGADGWEHQFEVTKKLTDTLSLGLRHEVRRNAPDTRASDYSLLRLLLGLDF